MLAELGVIESFAREVHEPCYGSASCWGNSQLGHNDFVFNPFGAGWHLDRRRFDAWLAAQVAGRGVAARTGRRFLDVLAHGREGARLSLGEAGREREQIAARFVVDATGPRSRYAARLGATRRELDMLVSVAAFFELPQGSSFVYQQEQRWPDAPFWRERRAAGEPPGGAGVDAQPAG